MRANPFFFALVLASGCYSVRDDFRPKITDVPAVVDIGELRVVTEDELSDPSVDYTGMQDALYYGQLGAPTDAGTFGGATFNFRGTGGTVCVIVDPEAIFWNREITTQEGSGQLYKYDDVYTDDGDIDLAVGLTAYYTGSPGQEIGDFDASYTDGAGVDHALEFNECYQQGYFGDNVHAGRATVEWCNIDTSERAGVQYTAVLSTFSLPIDDSILNYGAMVFDGKCDSLPWFDADGIKNTGASECVIPDEVDYAEPDGVAEEDKYWFPEMEKAFCTGKGKFNPACEDHLDDASPPCNEPEE